MTLLFFQGPQGRQGELGLQGEGGVPGNAGSLGPAGPRGALVSQFGFTTFHMKILCLNEWISKR